MNVTLDGQSIESFSPYVNFDSEASTVNIEATDCELSFAQLPLTVEYSDSRGVIESEFALISLNQNACNTTEEYHYLNRPYFNISENQELDFILSVAEGWIWKAPIPLHEDNRTDEHDFTILVSLEQPASFLEYFELTQTLSIAQNVTTSENVGTYEIKITLRDEQNVTSSQPLLLKVTIIEEKLQVKEQIPTEENENNDSVINYETLTEDNTPGEIIAAMRFEKATLKEKFDGLIFEQPKVKIKTVTQQGVIHLDFTNKMRVYYVPPKKKRRSLSKDLTIYQEQQ